MSYLLIAQSRTTTNKTHRKWYATGTEIWSADHGNRVYGIAADSEGNIYTCGLSATSSAYNALRKWDPDGTEITDSDWPRNIGSANVPTSVAVDTDDAVYVGSNWSSTSSRTVIKYASDSTLVWSSNAHGNTIDRLAVADDGHIIAVGARISSKTIRKLNSGTGSAEWSVDHGARTRAVAVDEDGYIYTAGDPSSGVTLRKWTTGGTEVTDDDWPISIGSGLYGVAVSGGVVVAVGLRTDNKTIWAYNSETGALLWSADHGDLFQAVARDASGYTYAGGANPGTSAFVRKYDASGTEITASYPINTLATVYDLHIAKQPDQTTSAPALAFPISLAIPFPLIAFPCPALPLPISLAPPTVTPAPLPPDWTGPPPQTVYRGYLTGGSTLLEIPMASFQCRRFIGESTWLTVILPTHSAAWEADLAARSEGQLVIYAGVRAANGVETMGEMMRAWLTSVEVTREAWHSRIRLTGRVVPVAFTAQTRTLQNVQSWTSDNGRWAVTCTVDPLLRPNDTAVIGSLSFIVGSIDYEISPSRSSMTVKEVSDG